MPTIPQVRKTGPKTFIPLEAIAGGQLVEARVGSGVGVAAAGSLKVVGVALADAVTPASNTGLPVGRVLGLPGVDRVSVAYNDEVPVTYAADAAFGDRLIAASLGRVTPAGANPDARTIVGRCTETAGVVVATNPVGLAQIL